MSESFYTLESLEANNSLGFLIKRCGIVMTGDRGAKIRAPSDLLNSVDGADLAGSAPAGISNGVERASGT